MSLKDFIYDLAQYNYWANGRIAQWLRETYVVEDAIAASAEENQNLHWQVYHLLFVESRWLERVGGSACVYPPTSTGEMTLLHMLDALLVKSDELREFVGSLTEEQLLSQVSFTLITGEQFAMSVLEALQQCLNHGTYHLGQVVMGGRILGMGNRPATDYLRYAVQR